MNQGETVDVRPGMTIVSDNAGLARGRWRSPAKVNICLRVVGRRADGYHLLDSIFLPIDLCDDVHITVADIRARAPTSIDVRTNDPSVPTDETNLAVRAVRALFDECGIGAVVSVDLHKRIPTGAGLGGGSGNAATVLHGLNGLLALGLSTTDLQGLALRLGADVPFFLAGSPARVRGVGERIEALEHWPAIWLVVVVPPIQVPTPWAFDRYREAVPVCDAHGPSEAARLATGAVPDAALLVNDLERVVLPAFPEIAAVKTRLRDAGATATVMSGSGAAVVGLAPTAAVADDIAATLGREWPQSLVHVAAVPGVG